MIPYSEHSVFSNESLWAYEVARAVVEHIPDDPEFVNKLRCHEITRVVHRLLGSAAACYDGHYGMAEHSWLASSHWDPNHILDVYAVGMVPPVRLIDTLPTPQAFRRADRPLYELDRPLIEQTWKAIPKPQMYRALHDNLTRRGGSHAIDWWLGLGGVIRS